MRIVLAGIGRLKAGPERELFERYLTRAQAISRSAGFCTVERLDLEEGHARSTSERMREEAAALTARLAAGSHLLLFDERGSSMSSADFAGLLQTVRDRGAPALCLAVGGPDGFDDGFRRRANHLFAFGAAALPHQLVRVLAAEQLYRAFTILTGHPYHRA